MTNEQREFLLYWVADIVHNRKFYRGDDGHYRYMSDDAVINSNTGEVFLPTEKPTDEFLGKLDWDLYETAKLTCESIDEHLNELDINSNYRIIKVYVNPTEYSLLKKIAREKKLEGEVAEIFDDYQKKLLKEKFDYQRIDVKVEAQNYTRVSSAFFEDDQRAELLRFLSYYPKSNVEFHRGEDNDFFEFEGFRIDAYSGKVTEKEFVEEHYDSVIYNYNPVEGVDLGEFDRSLSREANDILHYFGNLVKPTKLGINDD